MSGEGAVEIRRRLSAPVDEVFRWWTEADLLRQWMSPVGEVEATVDLRVGGSFRIVMAGEGMVIEHTGEFIEITRPRRLVFTWSSPFTGPDPSLVTIELEPEGHDATGLRLLHSELPRRAADSHRGGWGAMFDRLERVLGAAAADASIHGGDVGDGD